MPHPRKTKKSSASTSPSSGAQQSAHIRAERLELARSKENRAKEMHAHKIQLDHIRVFLRNPNRNPNLFPESQNSEATPADTTTPLMTDLPITDHSPSSSPSASSASSALNSFLPPRSHRLQPPLRPKTLFWRIPPHLRLPENTSKSNTATLPTRPPSNACTNPPPSAFSKTQPVPLSCPTSAPSAKTPTSLPPATPADPHPSQTKTEIPKSEKT
jgi:hypothetical protein